MASYGGYATAILENWRPCALDEWNSLSILPDPNPWGDFDTHPMTLAGLPALGGSAYFYPGDADLTGVRVKPPPLDQHQYHARMKDVKEKKVTLSVEAMEEKRASSQKRRETRDRSASRYEAQRADHGLPPRGRPSEPRRRRG